MQKVDRITENTVTDKKLLNIHMADKAGTITKADISKEPTNFIEITTITAISIARIKLYVFALVPVAFAKSSSKVIANILLYKKMKASITTNERTIQRIASLG